MYTLSQSAVNRRREDFNALTQRISAPAYLFLLIMGIVLLVGEKIESHLTLRDEAITLWVSIVMILILSLFYEMGILSPPLLSAYSFISR